MTTKHWMRPLAAGVALQFLLLAGCFVGSLQPLYNSTDPVFDRNLLGTWVSADEKETIIFSRITGAGQDKQYHLVHITQGSSSVYQATMVEISKTRYLDVYSRDPSRRADMHYIPTHSIWKVKFEGDTLKLSGMSEAWLKEQIDKRIPQFPAQLVDDDVVLTGNTNELQEFVRGYGDQLFNDEPMVWKKR